MLEEIAEGLCPLSEHPKSCPGAIPSRDWNMTWTLLHRTHFWMILLAVLHAEICSLAWESMMKKISKSLR